MKKVLVTGCTSSHVSVDANRRSTRFAGLVNSSLSYSGHQSTMMTVPMSYTENDLKIFDSIVVGISPVSSLSAHKTYNALHALLLAKKCGVPTTLMFDAPEPHLIFKSLDAVSKSPELLVKSLYSSRDGYEKVSSDKKYFEDIISIVELVREADFNILVPSLPYFEYSRESLGIPSSKNTDIKGFNFDKLFVDNYYEAPSAEPKFWSTEDDKVKWTKNISNSLSKPVLRLKRSQYDLEIDYMDRLQNSYGYLLPVYRNDIPWWSRNVMLSLVAGVPVYSDWKVTKSLGDAWYGLPHYAEDASPQERYEISVNQKISYTEKLLSWEESSHLLSETLGL